MKRLMLVFIFLVAGIVFGKQGDFVDSISLQQDASTVKSKAQPRLRAANIHAQWAVVEPTVVPEDAKRKTVPKKIGYTRKLPAGLMEPDWKKLNDGSRAFRFELTSEKAAGLRVQLAGSFFEGMELRVYNPATSRVFGPYHILHRGQDGTWWSPTIFGDSIGLEFYLPPDVEVPKALPELTATANLFCSDPVNCSHPDRWDPPLDCHEDVTCFPGLSVEADAVGLMYFIINDDCYTCTGALLNRGPGDLAPLFMTANHCIGAQWIADSLEVHWFYESETCNGLPPDFNTLPMNQGALVLKRDSSSDWTLLGLLDEPQSGSYLGWNANEWDSGDNATGIHHPASSHKRICSGESSGSTDDALFGDETHTFEVDVWDVDLTFGTTEGGSSGSPILDSSRHVRGTLTGGSGECAPVTKYYGRLDLAYENLRYYLGNSYIASPVYVNHENVGDPENEGYSEQGTSALPFNTVLEATFAVRSGDTVMISPGNYDEQMRIWRPMTLRCWGSGTVRIGE